MDYLEEARKTLEERTSISGETENDYVEYNAIARTDAIRALTMALIAIAEHLTEFGTGAAMRQEIDKLGDAVILSTQVFEQHNERLTDVEIAVSSATNNQANRLDKIEDRIDAHIDLLRRLDEGTASLGLWRETARERFNDIELGLEKIADWQVIVDRKIEDVERQQTATLDASVEIEDRFDDALERGAQTALDAAESVIRRLTNRVHDLEMPDVPRVGVWQQCGACQGSGTGEQVDERTNVLFKCGVCGGSGMVEVYVKKATSFSVATLESKLEESRRTIDKILQAVNDSDLSREEMIKEVDKAFRLH